MTNVVRAALLLPVLLLAPAPRDPATAGPGTETAPAPIDHPARRSHLADRIGDGYAVVLGQPLTDVLRPRQEGHFLWLTGIEDPGAALLLAGSSAEPLVVDGRAGDREAHSVIFLLHANPRFRQFHGLRWRVGSAAEQALGVDVTRPHPGAAELGSWLSEVLPPGAALHLPAYAGPDHAPVRELRAAMVDALTAERSDVRVVDLHPTLAALRAVKDPAEVARLRRAITVTIAALGDARARIRPDSSEAAVEGALIDGMRVRGARPSYPPVVAGGANAAIPHYMTNDAPLVAGELLLIDAGAAFERYAADVTRVFPVSGTFSERQREVLDVVRRAQAAAIAAVKPGATFADVDRAARTVIGEAGYGEFFLHGTSHHVGLDVHDPGPRRLEAGMTLTVEPGIYLEEEGLGVRIEDIVLVTAGGCEILTRELPSDADAIEAWMRPAVPR